MNDDIRRGIERAVELGSSFVCSGLHVDDVADDALDAQVWSAINDPSNVAYGYTNEATASEPVTVESILAAVEKFKADRQRATDDFFARYFDSQFGGFVRRQMLSPINWDDRRILTTKLTT